MKKFNLYAMALLGLLVAGCDNDGASSKIKNLIKEKGDFNATLIDKENHVFIPKEGTMTSVESYYYFDTDLNLKTAEYMLQVTNHNNSALLNSYNKAITGKTQKISEWHNDLTDDKSIYIYYMTEKERQKQ
ncbi:MAG: hypothetical protein J6P93_02525 [Alphaproteobacteria bacterium]|nr:hypothetical protein [Alphaproteobacteria bacterium]